MTTRVPEPSNATEVLNLRSLASDETQTAQSQPMMGTPWDVPVPKNIIRDKLFSSAPFMARRYSYL